MYPFLRLIYAMQGAKRQPPIDLFDTHHSTHICWPWDLDMWMELNNGRALSIYDLGRIPLAQRAGLIATLEQEKWGLTIAGSVVRYRRRVRGFDHIAMRSRMLGWDHRFLYLEQAMFRRDGECYSHAVYRTAVTDAKGIVTPDRILSAMNKPEVASPPLPDWVQGWISAEDKRPWPPMEDAAPSLSDRHRL